MFYLFFPMRVHDNVCTHNTHIIQKEVSAAVNTIHCRLGLTYVHMSIFVYQNGRPSLALRWRSSASSTALHGSVWSCQCRAAKGHLRRSPCRTSLFELGEFFLQRVDLRSLHPWSCSDGISDVLAARGKGKRAVRLCAVVVRRGGVDEH